jgi:hypothetical protein
MVNVAITGAASIGNAKQTFLLKGLVRVHRLVMHPFALPLQ